MSDIKELKEPCVHGRYDEHMWSGPKTVEMNQPQPMDECKGGKLVKLQVKQGDPLVFWKGQTVLVEVSDDEWSGPAYHSHEVQGV